MNTGVEDRFWSKVQKTENCWLWMGARTKLGYGQRGGRKTGRRYTHRLSWEMRFGPIPEGLCVLHHCDNPPCVNPDHLFLGTKKDNTQDMIAKGRGRGPRFSGETHPGARL